MKQIIISIMLLTVGNTYVFADTILARCFLQTPINQIDIIKSQSGELKVIERNSASDAGEELRDSTMEVIFNKRHPADLAVLINSYKMISSCFPKHCKQIRTKVLSLSIRKSFSNSIDRGYDSFLTIFENISIKTEPILFCELVSDLASEVLNPF